MKILADKNILAVADSFSRHGELRLFDGRGVSRQEIGDADALLVRSITTVDESLLGDTQVRFVGTATSGVDHIDLPYLRAAGIQFADARGSNANSVVDYCFAALAHAAAERGFTLEGCRVGIVGAGAVGGLFAGKLESLGVEVRRCDPILAATESPAAEYFTLVETLDCDVLSLHVPLTKQGPCPTHNLIGHRELERLKRNTILINACRGGVVNENALRSMLSTRSDVFCAFDVWANEPSIDTELAARVDLATPHIAGYSRESKAKATQMLASAFESFFDLAGKDDAEVESPRLLELDIEAGSRAEWQTLLGAFSLPELSAEFKNSLGSGSDAFDSMRAKLLQRREFESSLLDAAIYSKDQRRFLTTLGFRF